MSEDNAELDPRIQVELEKLNTTTDEINKLELEYDVSGDFSVINRAENCVVMLIITTIFCSDVFWVRYETAVLLFAFVSSLWLSIAYIIIALLLSTNVSSKLYNNQCSF